MGYNDIAAMVKMLGASGWDKERVITMLTHIKSESGDDLEFYDNMTILVNSYHKHVNLAQDVKDWIEVTTDNFNVTNIQQELQIITKEERKNLNVILHRLVKDDIIERNGKQKKILTHLRLKLIELSFIGFF